MTVRIFLRTFGANEAAGFQNDDPSFAGGANTMSLAQASENYVRFGTCEPSFSDKVRSPNIGDIPPPTVVAGLDSANRVAIQRGVKTSILGIVRGMLSGQIAIFEGCSAVAAFAWPLTNPNWTTSCELSRESPLKLTNFRTPPLVIVGHQTP